jgi:type II secretory pathway component PulJ
VTRLLRSRLADERGTSMAEVIVVTLLMGIVGVVIITSMTTTVRTSRRVEDRSFVNVDLRNSLEVVERDLRAANPVDALPSTSPISLYRTQLSFTVFCADASAADCGSDHLRSIVYRLNGNSLERVEGTQVRELIGPSGPDSLPAANQRGAIVNDATRPVFRYFDVHGEELETLGTAASPATHFRDCTISVQLDLLVVVEAGDVPVTDDLATNGTLRNFHEVDGC